MRGAFESGVDSDSKQRHTMKHLLIDALSVNNLSGRHVLMGHVRELVAALSSQWRFTLLTHRDNLELAAQAPPEVAHVCAPTVGTWWARTRWGALHFNHLAREHQVNLVFSPSGMLSPGCALPQLVLAQNPWPLVAKVRGSEAWRLRMQRAGFARAQRRAWRMAFNSAYMQQLYAGAFGPPPRPSFVAYQGIDPALLANNGAGDRHDPHARGMQVLAVSVMARHKAIDVLVEAFALLAPIHPAARLVLIGSWPDRQYQAEILQQIARLGLQDRVDMHGHVDQATLHAHYRSARVFCLPSRCESFGIPAVEAQAAGTPTVVASGTAAPEIIGTGGLVVAQDDPQSTAQALAYLLDDDAAWAHHSKAARANAERYRWPGCSAPLVEALHAFAAAGEHP